MRDDEAPCLLQLLKHEMYVERVEGDHAICRGELECNQYLKRLKERLQ